MDLSHDTEGFAGATRRDGWTPELKARFLAILAESGNARLAARRCGMSAQSAYVQRRRDAQFARTWSAAMRLARDHCEQVLGDRAIEGVEEPVWYRGELVGTRRRYDTRLLLAHLARLDRLERDELAEEDAGRFDEMVALIAGEDLPAELTDCADFLPESRGRHAWQAVDTAKRAMDLAAPPAENEEAEAERAAMLRAAGNAACHEAARQWDAWRDRAYATVDRVLGNDDALAEGHGGFVPQDCVNLSTSQLEQPAEDQNPPSSSPARGGGPPALRLAGRPAAQDKLPFAQRGVEGAVGRSRACGEAPARGAVLAESPLHRRSGGPPPRAGEDRIARFPKSARHDKGTGMALPALLVPC